MIKRTIENKVKEKLNSGKTTLIKKILKDKDYLFLDADDPSTRRLLQSPTTEQIRTIIGDYKYIFLDEAQRIDGIGLTLKIITDQFKDIQQLTICYSINFIKSEDNSVNSLPNNSIDIK